MSYKDAKKYVGKYVKGSTKSGSKFEGKVLFACNEYCDKWALNFEDLTQIETEDILSIDIQ
jgi:hypothetical protein